MDIKSYDNGWDDCLDSVIELIKSHKDCTEYHKIKLNDKEYMNVSCLVSVINELKKRFR